MLFHSDVFIFVFLPVTFCAYFLLSAKTSESVSRSFLLAASLFFYSYWNIVFLPLILLSIIFNYSAGRFLSEKRRIFGVTPKSILTLSVLANVILLFYYKYYNFFITNLNLFSGSSLTLLSIALPLGISFFTFQQIAYLVDSYRGETKEYSLVNYALFVTFFPQLIAGPITHHKDIISQFEAGSVNKINFDNIAKGLFIFSIGIFKKAFIADNLSGFVTMGFTGADSLSFTAAWCYSLAATIRIYFDFSGYADMAIGLGLLFNIRIPVNFNSPYRARSVADFWRRWHITLSQFVNKYVFIPILRAFGSYSLAKAMAAIFVSMVVIGLWHGASWTFIVFGVIHGIAVAFNHLWKKKISYELPDFAAWLMTFIFVSLSITIFTAQDMSSAGTMFSSMFSLSNISLHEPFIFIRSNWHKMIILIFGMAIILYPVNSIQKLNEFKINYNTAVFAAVCFTIGIFFNFKSSQFIYFVF
ncbi:MAG: MBOAT family protein [Deferribacterales bacterium]